MKFLLCALFLATAVLASAHDLKDDYDSFADDYDNFYDYDQLKEEGEKIETEIDKLDAENDLKVKEDINNFRGDKIEYEQDILDGIDEYQLEDNRDKSNEDEKEIPVNDNNLAADDNADAIDNEEAKKRDTQADYALLWGDDSVAPLPVPEAESDPEEKVIPEKTLKVQENEDDSMTEEEIKKAIDEISLTSEERADKAIVEETKKILDGTDDSFDSNDENKADKTKKTINENDQLPVNLNDLLNHTSVIDAPKLVIIDDMPIENAFLENDFFENVVHGKDEQIQENDADDKSENTANIDHDTIEEEDTVDKVYADLNLDLDKLIETLDKLSDDDAEDDEKLEDIFDKLNNFKEPGDIVEDPEKVADDEKDDTEYSDVEFEKILLAIANENDLKVDDENMDLKVELNDEKNEFNPDDASVEDAESFSLKNTSINDDASVEDVESLSLDTISKNNINPAVNGEKITETKEIVQDENIIANLNSLLFDSTFNAPPNDFYDDGSSDTGTLTDEQVDELKKLFSMTHSDLKNVNLESDDQHIAPIHIKLNVDTPEVVNSPNYPDAYPTNNIVDWVFDGEGMGIELNVTDLQMRGAMGDYLLVKPGGMDDSGHDGILFTYRLTSEKQFRFLDVDRLFLRFEATPAGLNNQRGFQLSAKMIAPIPDEPEPIPEPEAVLDPPTHRHTLFFATPVHQFLDLQESFQRIIADMAEEYIKENEIDPGLNTTAEITQITSITHCPVTWPNYELCSAITYGVPLSYEDPDEETAMLDEAALVHKWETYKNRDPYALRLRQLGLAEFEQPPSSVLIAWLVIASAVLISMAMLAVVLWRFSCFEDYTRMKTYSDTDSLHNEKRGLDLYPTPHQTLPALYADHDLKWQENEDSTRVDMGGFANKNYARDMYDFESDEEAITPRDRTGAVTARDIYSGSVA